MFHRCLLLGIAGGSEKGDKPIRPSLLQPQALGKKCSPSRVAVRFFGLLFTYGIKPPCNLWFRSLLYNTGRIPYNIVIQLYIITYVKAPSLHWHVIQDLFYHSMRCGHLVRIPSHFIDQALSHFVLRDRKVVLLQLRFALRCNGWPSLQWQRELSGLAFRRDFGFLLAESWHLTLHLGATRHSVWWLAGAVSRSFEFIFSPLCVWSFAPLIL